MQFGGGHGMLTDDSNGVFFGYCVKPLLGCLAGRCRSRQRTRDGNTHSTRFYTKQIWFSKPKIPCALRLRQREKVAQALIHPLLHLSRSTAQRIAKKFQGEVTLLSQHFFGNNI
jgi:hypothetical protein